jgi:hypothetical protein
MYTQIKTMNNISHLNCVPLQMRKHLFSSIEGLLTVVDRADKKWAWRSVRLHGRAEEMTMMSVTIISLNVALRWMSVFRSGILRILRIL